MRELIKVRFTGKLAARFGEYHEYHAHSLRELGNAFRVCIDGFESYILGQDKNGVMYHCQAFKTSGFVKDLPESMLDAPLGNVDEVLVSPVLAGSGGQIWRFIGGALLIGVGLVTGQMYLTMAGASMVLGGIAQMLAPAPSTPKSQSGKQESYLFSGLRNTADEDQPVPLVYGRVIMPLRSLLSQKVTTWEYR